MVVRLLALALVAQGLGCLHDPRGACAADGDCAGGIAGAFCAERLCQAPPRGAVEPLPTRAFSRSESLRVRARIDRVHGAGSVAVLLGGGTFAGLLEPDGAFAAEVPLRAAPAGVEGPVAFVVELRDDLGHRTALPGSVLVDDLAPRLSIDPASVPPAPVLRGKTVALRVLAQDLSTVLVTFALGGAAGAGQAQADGSFLVQAPTGSAPPGAATAEVLVTATDALGNAATVHVPLPLTRLKYSTPRPSIPYLRGLALSDSLIWVNLGGAIWTLDRATGAPLRTVATGDVISGDLATDGARIHYSQADSMVCRFADGAPPHCCGPYDTVTGGPALLGSTALVATSGGSQFASRLFAIDDQSGVCGRYITALLADFSGNLPAIARDQTPYGIIYCGAAQAVVAAQFDGLAIDGRATAASGRIYRGQPAPLAAASGVQPVLFNPNLAGAIDLYPFAHPLTAPDATPTSLPLTLSGINLSSPTVAADGTLTVATSDRRILALRPDGSLRWTATLPDDLVGSPVHGAGNLVYAGTSRGFVAALSLDDGAVVWSFAAGSPVSGTLAPGCDGVLYVSTLTGVLALVIDVPGLADSPWPRTGHDVRNTSDGRRPLRTPQGACLE